MFEKQVNHFYTIFTLCVNRVNLPDLIELLFFAVELQKALHKQKIKTGKKE